jgi:hypothetical protein
MQDFSSARHPPYRQLLLKINFSNGKLKYCGVRVQLAETLTDLGRNQEKRGVENNLLN